MARFDDCFFDYVKESIHKLNRVIATLKNLLIIRESKDRYKPEEYENLLCKTLNQALTENEVCYLYIRPITSHAWRNIRGLDEFKTLIKAPDQPEYRLTKAAEGYEFILPPLISKQTKNRCLADGMAIRKLIAELIEAYTVETGSAPEVFFRAILEFTHYVAKNSMGYATPDPDNLDIKATIDSLHNKLIRNDTVLDITLIQRGIASEISYTKLVIKRDE